jgi:hypothetical protein
MIPSKSLFLIACGSRVFEVKSTSQNLKSLTALGEYKNLS